jgi:hypothetical protein
MPQRVKTLNVCIRCELEFHVIYVVNRITVT